MPKGAGAQSQSGGSGAYYRGAADTVDTTQATKHDARATLLRLPDAQFTVYMTSMAAIAALVTCAALDIGGARQLQIAALGISNAQLVAALMAAGPLAVGALMLFATRPASAVGTGAAGLRKLFLYPFHKESLLGAFGLNTALGFLVTVVPVYHTVHMLLAEPGDSAYCQIWGC